MKKLKEIWSKTDDVIARYPMVLVMAFIAAICTVIFIFRNSPRYFQDNSEDELFAISKIIIVACLGISLMFAVKMISQRIGKGFVWEILGVLFLIGFYFLLPKKNEKKYLLPPITLYSKGFQVIYFHLLRFQSLIS